MVDREKFTTSLFPSTRDKLDILVKHYNVRFKNDVIERLINERYDEIYGKVDNERK